MTSFVSRCYAVSVNVVQQLSGLYRAKDNRLWKTTFKNVQLLDVWRCATRALLLHEYDDVTDDWLAPTFVWMMAGPWGTCCACW